MYGMVTSEMLKKPVQPVKYAAKSPANGPMGDSELVSSVPETHSSSTERQRSGWG